MTRPALPFDLRKTQGPTYNDTLHALRYVKARAEAEGMTPTQFVRHAVRKYARYKTPKKEMK